MTQTLVYLELTDAFLDRDQGASRMLYRISRDFPWVLEDGWELERWGVWPPAPRRSPSPALVTRGPTLPVRRIPLPIVTLLAWVTHFVLMFFGRERKIVVAYNPFSATGAAVACLLRRRPPELVVRVIGSLTSKALLVHGSRLRFRAFGLLERFVLRRAALAVPMGSFTRGIAREAGVAEERILELAHPPRWFGTDVPATGDAEASSRILCAARLTREKGVDVLLQAFTLIAGDVPDALLEIAGDGPERGALERMAGELGIAERVRFHGWIPADGMPGFYCRSLVAVLPSRVEEGLGMVLVEAGLAGCALVGSDLGGIREMVQPGRTGILVPPEDPEALAVALRTLLGEADEASRLGANARREAIAYVERRGPALEELHGRLEGGSQASSDGGRRRGATEARVP